MLDHAQGGALPGVAGIDLGHRDVEVGAQAVFHAAHHLPLVFQRVRAFNANLQREIRDHVSSCCRSPGKVLVREEQFRDSCWRLRYRTEVRSRMTRAAEGTLKTDLQP